MREADLDIVTRIPLFAGLPSELFPELIPLLEERAYPAGAEIVREGMPGESMFCLLAGSVEIYKTLGDERIRICELGPGEFFGELAIIEHKPRNASVRTLEAVRCCELSKDSFYALSNAHPKVALRVLEMLSRRLRESDAAFCGELAKKNRDLTLAYKELQQLDLLKSNFITLVSHELFTPVTIISNASLLLRGEQMTDERREEFLTMIEQQGQRLNDQIRQIIALESSSHFDRTQLLLEEVDAASYFAELAQRLAPLASSRSLTFTADFRHGTRTFSANPGRLASAIEALFFNAVRFTANGGSVTLRTYEAEHCLHCAVIDTGIGIAPEHQAKIFEPFTELRPIEHHSSGHLEFMSSGMGLGLTLARTIATLHGGSLWLKSEVGKGSTFTISLPLG